MVYKSLGSVLLNATIDLDSGKQIAMVVSIDLVDLNIPLLVSRRSLAAMRARIDFSTNCLQIQKGNTTKLPISDGGHMLLRIYPHRIPLVRSSTAAHIYATDLEGEVEVVPEEMSEEQNDVDEEGNVSEEMSQKEVLKVHKQLGHATKNALTQLFRQANRKCCDQTIADALNECNCHRINSDVQKPFTNRHPPAQVGDVVFADVFFSQQRSRAYPAIVFTESVTRFCVGSMLSDVSHTTVVTCFVQKWIGLLGPPRRLIVDSGTHFQGKQWAMVSNLFGIAVIVVPVGSHHSIGRVERHIQILNHAYQSIDESVGSEISPDTKLAMTIMAHNTTPSAGAQIAPIFALTGRTGIIEELPKESVTKTVGERYDSDELAFWKRMIAVQEARARIPTYDAKKTVSKCLKNMPWWIQTSIS